MKFPYLAVALFLLPAAAYADLPAANTCAGSLSAQGKMLYAAAQPNIKPDSKIADELRSVARPLVMDGKMNRSDAKTAAEAAGKCLAMIHK